jgi:hypothetical protein
MKKLLAALTVALLVSVAIGVGAASATHSNGEGPKQDLVSGTSHFEGGGFDAQLHVNATSSPTREDPRGHFFYRQSSSGTNQFDVSGRVTCVNVNGNLAGLAGEVTKSKNPSVAEGSGVRIGVEDRGQGAVDAGRIRFNLLAPPPECPFISLVDFQKGNFIVHDANAVTLSRG